MKLKRLPIGVDDVKEIIVFKGKEVKVESSN